MPAKEDVRVEVDNEDMETETTVQPNNAVPDTGSAQENAAQPTDDTVPVQDWFNPSNPSNPADALPTATQHIQTKNQETTEIETTAQQPVGTDESVSAETAAVEPQTSVTPAVVMQVNTPHPTASVTSGDGNVGTTSGSVKHPDRAPAPTSAPDPAQTSAKQAEEVDPPEQSTSYTPTSAVAGLVSIAAQVQQALAGLPPHATAAAGTVLTAEAMETDGGKLNRKRQASTEHVYAPGNSRDGSSSSDTDMAWDCGDEQACAGHTKPTGHMATARGGKVTLKPMTTKADKPKEPGAKSRGPVIPPAPVRSVKSGSRGRGQGGPSQRGK